MLDVFSYAIRSVGRAATCLLSTMPLLVCLSSMVQAQDYGPWQTISGLGTIENSCIAQYRVEQESLSKMGEGRFWIGYQLRSSCKQDISVVPQLVNPKNAKEGASRVRLRGGAGFTPGRPMGGGYYVAEQINGFTLVAANESDPFMPIASARLKSGALLALERWRRLAESAVRSNLGSAKTPFAGVGNVLAEYKELLSRGEQQARELQRLLDLSSSMDGVWPSVERLQEELRQTATNVENTAEKVRRANQEAESATEATASAQRQSERAQRDRREQEAQSAKRQQDREAQERREQRSRTDSASAQAVAAVWGAVDAGMSNYDATSLSDRVAAGQFAMKRSTKATKLLGVVPGLGWLINNRPGRALIDAIAVVGLGYAAYDLTNSSFEVIEANGGANEVSEASQSLAILFALGAIVGEFDSIFGASDYASERNDAIDEGRRRRASLSVKPIRSVVLRSGETNRGRHGILISARLNF